MKCNRMTLIQLHVQSVALPRARRPDKAERNKSKLPPEERTSDEFEFLCMEFACSAAQPFFRRISWHLRSPGRPNARPQRRVTGMNSRRTERRTSAAFADAVNRLRNCLDRFERKRRGRAAAVMQQYRFARSGSAASAPDTSACEWRLRADVNSCE